MEFFEVLRTRRSARRFTSEEVSQKDLDAILVAANIAPIGSNKFKDIHLTVVQDRAILDALSEATVKRFADKALLKKIADGLDIPDLTDSAEQRKFDPFYGVPVAVFVSHRRQDVQPGIEYSNAAIVAYTMHLAATDLGLGSVLIWGALESMREIPELDKTDLLGLPDDFEPLLGIAIGHQEASPRSRKPNTGRLSANYL